MFESFFYYYYCSYFIDLIPSPHDMLHELWAHLPACPVTEQELPFSLVTVHKSSFSKQFVKHVGTSPVTPQNRYCYPILSSAFMYGGMNIRSGLR